MRRRGKVDGGSKPHAADIEDIGQPFQAMHGIGPNGLEPQRPSEKVVFLIEVERGETGGASQRVGGERIALID